MTTPVFKRKSSEPPFSKFSQIIRAQLSRQWLNRLAQANSIQVDLPIGRHTHSVHFHSTLIMLRRLSQKENFQHQPSILSWKILARLVGATSGSRDEIEVFATYVNGFHPSLKFTWIISDVLLPFLDLCLKPVSDRLLTSIHYKDTDTHSYLNYTSSHPARCKNSIPYSQFLRLRRICSEDNDFENKCIEMASFFQNRDYPSNVI